MGAFFEPSISAPVMLSLALAGSAGAWGPAALFCFSSNCRICRNSSRIWLACSRVIPSSFGLVCAPSGNSNASGRTAVTHRKNFFIVYLILLQHQHVLDIFDSLFFFDQ